MKPKYQFVPEDNEKSDVPIRTLIRAHVMQDFHRKVKNGTKTDVAAKYVSKAMDEFERRNTQLPKEKWEFDPFSTFPVKLGPESHDQLSWCKFLFPNQGAYSHNKISRSLEESYIPSITFGNRTQLGIFGCPWY
jgi:hypothetical protein